MDEAIVVLNHVIRRKDRIAHSLVDDDFPSPCGKCSIVGACRVIDGVRLLHLRSNLVVVQMHWIEIGKERMNEVVTKR